MKTEFISLSPAGVIALCAAGGLGTLAIMQRDLGAAAIGLLCLAVVRENSRESSRTNNRTDRTEMVNE